MSHGPEKLASENESYFFGGSHPDRTIFIRVRGVTNHDEVRNALNGYNLVIDGTIPDHSIQILHKAGDNDTRSIDKIVSAMFGLFTHDFSVWAHIGERYPVDLCISLKLSAWRDGLQLSPETLQKLVERNLHLTLYIEREDTEEAAGNV